MKYMIYIFAIFLAINVHGQDAKQILNDIQIKFESINDLSAEFVQTTQFFDSKKPVTNKGKLLYQKENKYRIVFTNLTIVSDGETIWNYNQKTDKVVINLLENESSAFSIREYLFDFPLTANIEFIGKEKIDGKSYNLIQLKSKNSDDSNLEIVKVWASEDNLIKKISVFDKAGSEYSFELANLKLDSDIPGSKFTFETPEGSEVIDLR